MKYGRGYLRDAPEKRTQRDARTLAARLGASPPSAVSLRSFELPCFDQGPSSSCCGHSVAMAIAMSLRAQGTPLAFTPSPAGIYTVGRAIGRGSPDVPLSDTGAQLADVMAGIARWGVHPLGALATGRNSDVTPDTVNREPNLVDLENDEDCLVVGEWRIEDDGDVVMVMKSVLAQNIPIVVGGYVDSAYESYKSGSAPVGPPNESDPNGGGHAQAIVGYSTLPNGSTVFDVLSSWGTDFGDVGHALVTEGWARAQWDRYAMTVRRAP